MCSATTAPVFMVPYENKANLYGQNTTWPLWAKYNLTFMGKIQLDLYGQNTTWPLWAKYNLTFMGKIQLDLYGQNTTWPLWAKYNLTFMGKIQLDLYGKNATWPLWAKYNLTFMGKNTTWPLWAKYNLTFMGKKPIDSIWPHNCTAIFITCRVISTVFFLRQHYEQIKSTNNLSMKKKLCENPCKDPWRSNKDLNGIPEDPQGSCQG